MTVASYADNLSPKVYNFATLAKKTAGEDTPDLIAVREAAKAIKRYCNSRNSNPETDCIECPIKDICYNEPYLWEV